MPSASPPAESRRSEGWATVRVMRSTVVAAALVLAACPRPQSGTGGPTAQGGAGCPAASGVYIASYASQDGGRGTWVVPLHAAPLGAGAQVADYAPIDAAAASAAGVPAAPTGTLWLATANGQPCRASVGGYYAAKVPEQGSAAATVSYGFEITGCAAPGNPDEAGGIVLVSEEAPTGCQFEQPQPVAARLGQMDAQKQWQRPAQETPIPAALAAAVPAKDCAAPACEKLWAFGEVMVGGRAVAWSGAVNYLSIGDPAQQCSWPTERFSGFFVAGADGSAVKVTEGQTHPLVLSAVLVDGGGAKVLLAEGPGEYATYDVAGGNPKLARVLTWMIAPPDAWESVDHIGPVCDPR
jgi:hypothetical protein